MLEAFRAIRLFPVAALPALILLTTCIFNGCESGGGSSSETESTVTGQVFYPGDVPAEGARILLLSTANLGKTPPSGPDSARAALTDQEGRFYFTQVEPGYYSLQVSKDDANGVLSTQSRIEVGNRSVLLQLPPVNLEVGTIGEAAVVAPSGHSPKSILFLYGEAWTDTTDAFGRFSLPPLPAGLHLLRVVPMDPTLASLETAFRPEAPIGMLEVGPVPVIRVADFEHKEVATPFSVVYPKGKWFTFDNLASNGGPGTFVPSSMRTNFATAYTDSADTSSWRGSSLAMSYRLGGNPSATYGLIGFTTGNGATGRDFSHLDSVVFYAKGNGVIRFEFQCAPILFFYKDWHHFSRTFGLSPAWTRISIPVTQLSLAADSPALKNGLTWAQASKEIINIVFIADDPTDFWMDDLEFYGMSVQDMGQ